MRKFIIAFPFAFAIAFPFNAHAIVEDDAQWDCRTMGNHICGIDNSQHVQSGIYDNNGKLFMIIP